MKSVPVYKAMFLALCVAFLFCLWSELGIRRLKRLHLTCMSRTLVNVNPFMTSNLTLAQVGIEDPSVLENTPLLLHDAAVSIPDRSKLCFVNLVDSRSNLASPESGATIYFVTPTYPRPEQIPELTRLSHTLMHVPKLHWIVADDQPECSDEVLSVIRKSGLPFTHLSSPKPHKFKGKIIPRGVSNRRAALSWLRNNANTGVLYFGDDDNTVDLQLFDEIRKTKKVSMFPVGLIGGYGVSSPVVRDGKVIAFYDSWPAARTFPVDMAGFAVNLKHLSASANMPYIAGHEEDRFLVSLGLQITEIEPLAFNCSKVLVWHTRTAKYQKPTIKMTIEKINELQQFPNFANLLQETARMGMASLDPKKGVKPLVIRNKYTFESLNEL